MAKNNKSTNKNKPSFLKKTKDFISNENVHFISGLLLLFLSTYFVITFTSFFSTGAQDYSIVNNAAPEALNQTKEIALNSGGGQGAKLSNLIINDGFGVASIFMIIFIFVAGLKLMKNGNIRLRRWFVCCVFLTIWCSIFLGYVFYDWYKDSFFYLGGKHGLYISNWLKAQIGPSGLWITLIATAVCFMIYINIRTINVIKGLFSLKYIKKDNSQKQEKETSHENENTQEDNTDIPSDENNNETKDTQVTEPDIQENNGNKNVGLEVAKNDDNSLELELPDTTEDNTNEQISDNENDNVISEPKPKTPEMEIEIIKPEIETKDIINNTTSIDITEPYDPRRDLEYYKFPTIDLLKKYENSEPSINMEEQNNNKNNIIKILRSFGIEICSIRATVGPTITLYEITPEQGVRIAKIRGLEDDIALSLKALGIRIIAPIPGKGTIGIEVPNSDPKIVSMQSIIASKKFQESTFDLPIAFGKTITNDVFMVDLAKMPHILVAGATGQGKSVGLNAIITSLLYKKHPAELKFVLIDPKKVEFSIYSIIEKHFLAKLPDSEDAIITDFTKVIHTLNSLCIEMDTRYDLLKAAHVRNIKEYNQKFISRQLNPEKGHKYMPYIVVIIDEFGDLIMTAGKDIELPIARIAQLARAVGIHMIIATQRPTTQIITGTIKANFPARVAFRVSSMIDSRTIIDRPGANQLIGRGDMLFLQGNDPVRVQCAFVDTPEVEKITHYICEQQGYTTAFYLPEYNGDGGENGSSADVDMNKLDPMFEDAARLIVIHQQGSTSLIQRKFSIGYNRAGRIMDQLEKAGIVGPSEGSKPRQVMCVDETDLQMKLNNLHNK